jgi:undecaprenyl-diphosphatase
MSSILYGLVVSMLIQRLKAGWQRVLAVTIAVLAVLIIGFSRLALGAHYPSDVLAGWSIGLAWLILSWLITSRMRA